MNYDTRLQAIIEAVLNILQVRSVDREANVDEILTTAERAASCTIACYQRPTQETMTVIAIGCLNDREFARQVFNRLADLTGFYAPGVMYVPPSFKVDQTHPEAVQVSFTL